MLPVCHRYRDEAPFHAACGSDVFLYAATAARLAWQIEQYCDTGHVPVGLFDVKPEQAETTTW